MSVGESCIFALSFTARASCVVLRVHQWHRARARGGVATRVFICARESRELVKKGWGRMCERAARLHVGCVACEQW